MKTCAICKHEKPLNHFYARRMRAHGKVYVGLQTRCKECHRILMKEYFFKKRWQDSRAG